MSEMKKNTQVYTVGQATPRGQKVLWDAVFQDDGECSELVAYVEGSEIAELFAEAPQTKAKLEVLLESIAKIRERCCARGEYNTADALKSLLDRT